jgi:ferredoxin--NADP+ reductase
VIGTNKKDATETADLLIEDALAGRLGDAANPNNPQALPELLASRGVDVVAYSGWEAIDTLERERGEAEGRPRIKLSTWDELLATAHTAHETQ